MLVSLPRPVGVAGRSPNVGQAVVLTVVGIVAVIVIVTSSRVGRLLLLIPAILPIVIVGVVVVQLANVARIEAEGHVVGIIRQFVGGGIAPNTAGTIHTSGTTTTPILAVGVEGDDDLAELSGDAVGIDRELGYPDGTDRARDGSSAAVVVVIGGH